MRAVDGVSYDVQPGRTLGIVGESGSGKTVSSLSVMGLTRAPNATISGSIEFGGRDLATVSDEELQRVRGDDIAMIFQDPLSSLHPYFRIGDQLTEAVRAHRDVSDSQALDRARGDARARRHPRRAAARARLPARVLRRHAPARR